MKEQDHKDMDTEQAEDEARRAAGGLTASDEKELAERAAARDYLRLKAKRRMLSNISFIGQLDRIEGMLTVTIMHFCIGRLLNGGILPEDVKPDEENMEAFVKLMVRSLFLPLLVSPLPRSHDSTRTPIFCSLCRDSLVPNLKPRKPAPSSPSAA